MEAARDPGYLAATAQAVSEFLEALERFLELHVPNLTMAPGTLPAVFPLDKADPEEIKRRKATVDIAAGRAGAASSLTGIFVTVQGIGNVDPITAWHTITQPKPVLEPDDIRSSSGLMIGRLQQLLVKAEAEAPPDIGAAAMHPLIWSAAKRLWSGGNFREAVAAGAEHLVAHVKEITGRKDVADTAIWQQAFAAEAPELKKPRLRWPGDPSDRSVKAMNEGLRLLAPGVQLTIRNGAVHSTSGMEEQEALERLAVLSLLARWVEGCELVEHAPS